MSLLNFNKDQTFCITLGSKKAAPHQQVAHQNVWFHNTVWGESTSTKSIRADAPDAAISGARKAAASTSSVVGVTV